MLWPRIVAPSLQHRIIVVVNAVYGHLSREICRAPFVSAHADGRMCDELPEDALSCDKAGSLVGTQVPSLDWFSERPALVSACSPD
jgi:hypothetical protein